MSVDATTIVNGVLPNGNAVLRCMGCQTYFDKGIPPAPGQDDSQFVCEPCQNNLNKKVMDQLSPPMVFDGSI